MQAEKEWAKLKKKWRKLPEWSWLFKNFHPKTEEGILTMNVQNAVMNKLDIVAREMIEPIIGGSENYCCYFERRMLSDTEREHLFEIYRQLMAMLWKGNKLAVDFSEKEFAEWLSDTRKNWDAMKPKLSKFYEKLAISWEKYKKPAEETAYHG